MTTFTVAVVHAGVSDPSSTALLASRVQGRIHSLAQERGHDVVTHVVELRSLLPELPAALASQHLGPRFLEAIEVLRGADAIVAAAPVYKAGASGLFTSFIQVLDNDLLIGTPVVLAATGGSARHALVVDQEMRALFAFLRTLVVPTSLYASTEDWTDSGLKDRIDRAAFEAVTLMESGFRNSVRDESWRSYQHSFGSAGGAHLDIDLSSDLMKLATGGSARVRSLQED